MPIFKLLHNLISEVPFLLRQWGLAGFYLLILLSLCLCPEPSRAGAGTCASSKLRIALDIGHSRKEPGAISARGKSEYSFNRRFVTEFVEANRDNPHLDLFIINQKGGKISLRARTEIALKEKADLFISIHHDSVNNKYLKKWNDHGRARNHADAFRGFSVFVSRENKKFDRSLQLARLIAKGFKADGLSPTLHHAEPIKGENRELLSQSLGIYNAPFAVLRTAKMPSVLVELGVIINREEEKLLDDPDYRKRLVQNLSTALQNTCG